MSVKKNVILKDKNLFVVKINLEAGDVVPEHHSSVHVTAVVISGKGIFTIENNEHNIEPGSFISMLPYQKHSIKAQTDLEIIVHHVTIKKEEDSQSSEKVCGMHS